MDFTMIQQNLEKLGYIVKTFDSAEEAGNYLSKEIDGKTVGIGGSVTAKEMNLYPLLSTHNQVIWHMEKPENKTVMETRHLADQAEIYISSVNGIAETGEIVNIDNTGNRLAGISFGDKKVYLLVGENKIAPDFEKALWRARNIAAPMNAKRLGVKTPCAVKGDKCYDCKSPKRICRELSVFWKKPAGCEYEVILIHEKLGY